MAAGKPRSPARLSLKQARRIWLNAQRLDSEAPFGSGPEAVKAAIEQLGYVQIDTINVIERCHHHILFSRIPQYRRADLALAQSSDKSVFEYWTHALAYVPVRDLPFSLTAMRSYRKKPSGWFESIKPADLKRVLKQIRDDGPLSIRDIEDEVLVDKDHPWASRKPSKRALELGFFTGELTISARSGIVKTYDLMDRHFGWEEAPRPATDRQVARHRLDRAVRSQGFVTLDAICHLIPSAKPSVRPHIEAEVRAKRLLPVLLEGFEKVEHWMAPELFDAQFAESERVHILSPFDPLIIQRKRTAAVFGYDHIFEAYLPRDKRKFGYFTLPVLVGDEIVAVLDLKTDRAAGKLLVQAWHWTEKADEARHKQVIEEELSRFERFQLGA